MTEKPYTYRTYRPDWVVTAKALYDSGVRVAEIAISLRRSAASINVWRVCESWDQEAHGRARLRRRFGRIQEAYERGESWALLLRASGHRSDNGLRRIARRLRWDAAAREEALKVRRRGGHDSVVLMRLRSKTHKHAKRAAAVGDVSARALARLLADSLLCAYCATPITEENRSFDHIEPVSRGGEHGLSNIVVCCQSCNSGKKDRPLLVWLASRRTA